jgi:hypothetical protein
MTTAALEELAGERGLTMEDIEQALRTLPHPGRGSLSEHERGVLASFGVDPDRTTRSPLVSGVLRRRQLERASLTTEQVARLLDREPSRIRQRLSGDRRSLLGFHRRSGRREWLLPAFQFELGLHEIDGWARLLQVLPPADETSPVALVAWLTEPQTSFGGRSRAEALAEGADVRPLLDEADAFGVLP